MTTTTRSSSSYKIALLLLVGAFLVGMAATFFLSARRGALVVDADYYQNGINYDRTRSGARNPGLAWTMSASIIGADLLVTVQDEKGAPVPGGKLLFHPRRAGKDLNDLFHLTESAPGTFRAPLTAAPGELRGTLRFTRGEASASQRVVLFN